MDTHRQPDDFIPYPTHRVVGTIVDAKEARAAIEALLGAGFKPHDIDILHGEKDCIAWIRQAQSMVSSRNSSAH